MIGRAALAHRKSIRVFQARGPEILRWISIGVPRGPLQSEPATELNSSPQIAMAPLRDPRVSRGDQSWASNDLASGPPHEVALQPGNEERVRAL
jgi:hypothetical protein